MLFCDQWIQNMRVGYVRESMGVEITLKKISSGGDYGDRYTIIDLNAKGKIYLNQKIGIGYRKWKGTGGDGSYIEIEMGTISSTRLPDYHVCVDEDTKIPYVEPEPEPEETKMNCQNSSSIEVGEIWTTYYADIRVINVYDTNSGQIGIKPRGKSETTYNVTEDKIINTDSTDFNLTVKPYSIFVGSDGTKIMQFTLCWEPKYTPPTMCTQTFKIQDQNGNPLNGNVTIGTTHITVLGTGTVSLEQGKSYNAVATFSDQPTQTKTFTACTTTTFTFNVVPDVGTLNITTNPEGASINIDGVSYGVTPRAGLELSLGVHNVLIKLAGYHDVTKEVTLQAGIPGIISVTMTQLEPEPEPDPTPGGYIGNITHEFSGDEIKIFVPVTNIWTKEICCYVDLRDQSGEFVEKAPMLLQTLKLLPGQSGLITIDSFGAINPSWDVNTVKGQTVSIELKGIGTVIGLCSPPPIGYTILHTKPFNVPVPEPEPDPDPEPDKEPGPGDYIGIISHEFSGDEIKIFVPVTNIWNKTACFYVDLRDQYGEFTDRAPLLLNTLKLGPGESGTLTINSYGAKYPSWNVTDVQGKTVSLELKSRATYLDLGFCTIPSSGYNIIHTKTYDVPMPPEPEPEPEPEPDGSGTIGEITKKITPQIGNDEVKFSIPITNNTSKEQCYIIKLFNEVGTEIAKAPTSIIPGQMANKIVAGGTETMILDSIGQFWHINDIEGQTVTFKLFGDPSFLTICPYFESGYSEVDSKTYVMESYIDPDKDLFVPGDLFDVDPEFDVPMVNVNKVAFKGIGNPNETIYIKVDRSLEIDEIITSFECGPDGKFSGEHDFDTGSYKLYAKKLGALGKESERHTVLVIDIIHLALLVIALGLTIWKIRRK